MRFRLWHRKHGRTDCDCLKTYDVNKKFKGFSSPGENRQLSIYNGLRDILTYAGAQDTVLIHDAARPCLSEALITACIGALDGHDGVLPVLPMKDTVYLSRDGKCVSSLLNRQEIFAGQAPELFVLGKYYEAMNSCFRKRFCRSTVRLNRRCLQEWILR